MSIFSIMFPIWYFGEALHPSIKHPLITNMDHHGGAGGCFSNRVKGLVAIKSVVFSNSKHIISPHLLGSYEHLDIHFANELGHTWKHVVCKMSCFFQQLQFSTFTLQTNIQPYHSSNNKSHMFTIFTGRSCPQVHVPPAAGSLSPWPARWTSLGHSAPAEEKLRGRHLRGQPWRFRALIIYKLDI